MLPNSHTFMTVCLVRSGTYGTSLSVPVTALFCDSCDHIHIFDIILGASPITIHYALQVLHDITFRSRLVYCVSVAVLMLCAIVVSVLLTYYVKKLSSL